MKQNNTMKFWLIYQFKKIKNTILHDSGIRLIPCTNMLKPPKKMGNHLHSYYNREVINLVAAASKHVDMINHNGHVVMHHMRRGNRSTNSFFVSNTIEIH